MKTIIKTAKEMAEILGISERGVTYRVKSIRRKAYALNKKVFAGEVSSNDAHGSMSEVVKKRLAGYNYEVKGTEDRPKYIFYKNV